MSNVAIFINKVIDDDNIFIVVVNIVHVMQLIECL